MATFNLQVGANPKGAEFSRRADGIVEMGKLLIKGTAAGDVKETTTGTDVAFAVSKVDEARARENESGGVAVYQYADNDVIDCISLVDGMILNLYAEGAISEGDSVSCGANGDVKTALSGDRAIGVALEAISDNERGQVVISFHTAA